MFKKLDHFVGVLPEGSRFSICSAEPRPITITDQRQLVRTGLEPAIPRGTGVLIQGVAGLFQCHGVSVTMQMLTSETFGELKVVLNNMSMKPFTVFPGDRVAEGIIVKLGG